MFFLHLQVAAVYKDPSVGNLINIVIVKLIVIHNEQVGAVTVEGGWGGMQVPPIARTLAALSALHSHTWRKQESWLGGIGVVGKLLINRPIPAHNQLTHWKTQCKIFKSEISDYIWVFFVFFSKLFSWY